MNETRVDNRHSRVIEWKKVDWSALSPQGLEFFIKYEDMELHLGTCVSRGEINQIIKDILWRMRTQPTCVLIRQRQRGKFGRFYPGGTIWHMFYLR